MEVRDHKTTKLKNENFEYGAGVAGCGTGVAVPGSSKTRNKRCPWSTFATSSSIFMKFIGDSHLHTLIKKLENVKTVGTNGSFSQ